MTDAPPVTIITPRGKLVVLAVVCAVFAAIGVVVYAVSPETVLNLVVGVGVVGFFGIGGGFSLLSLWRRSAILRADDDGIRVESRATVPWADVDRIGSTSSHLGIRLRRYDALASDGRPEHAADALRTNRSVSGWDLTWPANLLDRSPAEAAAALSGRRP